MGIRVTSRPGYVDKSTEDFMEQPASEPAELPTHGFGLPPGITKAMAVAAGWNPGVGKGAFNPNDPVYATGGNPMGYSSGTGWNPGVPHSGMPVGYNTGGNPMGYSAGPGWGSPGNPHGGGWGGGLWGGGFGGVDGGGGDASSYGGNDNGQDGRNR